ncbi:hypothetical protein BH11BAC2_BH11BAC2_24610 [soil metagenome]
MQLRSLLILTVLLVSFSVANAQLYETRNYSLSDKPVPALLSAGEKKESSVVITDKRVTEYIFNKKEELEVYYTRHRFIHINEQGAVEDYNRIYLPVSDPADLVVLKARSISKSGKVTEMFKGDMKKITEDGSDYLILAVEGLEKDAELEYFYTIKINPKLFLTERLQSNTYTRHVELSIISPQNLVFEAKAYNLPVLQTDTVLGEKRYLNIVKDSIAPLESEKYSSYQANLLRIEIKLIKNLNRDNTRLYTWADAGRRFYQISHEQEKSAKKDIEKLASKLKLKGKLHEEQIKIVENFIKTTINIKSTGEEETIGLMLKRNYGSEQNVLSLCILMFEYLEIPNELVLTANRFDAAFDPDFDTWNYLDKYLIYFPESKKYMDPVSYFYRYGMVPYLYTGTKGLFIKKVTIGDVSNGVVSVKNIESIDPAANYDNMSVDVSFPATLDNVIMHYKREMGGYADNGIRASCFYASEEDRDKIAKEFIESSFKDVKIENTKVSNFNLTNNEYELPFIIESDLSVNTLLENASTNVLFSIGDVIGPQEEMYQEKKRQSDIDVTYCHSYKREINVEIPQGYSVKGLEKLNIDYTYTDGEKPLMGFVSTYKQVGNKISITINEYYLALKLPPSKIDDYKKVVNAAADFNKIKLVFVKG